jgi:hypothetical protein
MVHSWSDVAVYLLWIVLLAADVSAAPDHHACPSGRHSTLTIEIVSRPEYLRHDHNIGSDRLVLRSRDGKPIFSQAVDDGYLLCMGYSASTGVPGRDAPGRYLIGGVGEQGAWLVLRAISYLSEDGRSFEQSVFTKEDFLALTAVASPGGRFVAFIGGKSVADGLYVLDTQKNQIRRLGQPPAPPPMDLDFECEERFQWGTCWADGYVPIEPRVLRFDGETTLVATYGRDTHRARAKNRRVQKFALAP